MDNFSTTSSVSFGSKIKNAFLSLIIGIILFATAIIILWNNEGNYVSNLKLNDYVRKNVVRVDSNSINPINENKPIYLIGNLRSKEMLSDGLVSVRKSIILSRKIEMYQWMEEKQTETKNNVGGSGTKTTNYSYKKEWSSSPIDSSSFYKPQEYQNPKFPVNSANIYAKNVSLGAFKLSPDFVTKLIPNKIVTNLPRYSNCKILQNYYYCGQDPNSPQVGDYKLFYSYLPSGDLVSLIGKQYGSNVVKFVLPEGEFAELVKGASSPEGIIKNADERNSQITMIVRGLGILMLWMGLFLISSPLTVVADIIPILSTLANGLSAIVSAIIAVSVGLIVISIAWLAYRPIIASLVVLFLVLAIYYVLKTREN